MTYAIVNGGLHPVEEARVSIRDRGFRFGDGVFETIALHNGVPYQFAWHMARLSRGLEALKIGFDPATLQPLCRRLLHRNAARAGALRIQITRGEGSRGYLPEGGGAPTVVIETSPPPPPPPESATLWLSGHRKISPRALPVSVKLCQGVNATLARLEAQSHGCFEALMLNERGQPCEAGSANLFWARENRLYTPPLSCGLLEGSTRAALLRLCEVTEAETTLEELQQADALLLTASSYGVLAAGALQPQGHHWPDRALALRLQRRLMEDREQDARHNAAAWLIQ